MDRTTSRRRRLAVALSPLVAAALLIGGTATGAAAAPGVAADSAPASGTPSTVTADALPTAQINGVAWSQVIIGDTVYVGGSFSTARPAGAKPGKKTVSRANLLAYRLSTGALLDTWKPRTNGEVDALAKSADGRTVYAVGHFTSVNKTKRTRLAAFSASTGKLVSGFHPSVNSAAYAIAVHGSTVYVGGHFTVANGKKREQAAAFSAKTGSLKSWAPRTNGNVLALVVSGTGKSIVLGGRFSKVNGQTQYGSQRVTDGSGKKNLAWSVNNTIGNHGAHAAIYSLSISDGIVYGTGYSFHPKEGTPGKRLEGVFAADVGTGKIKWIEDCHGDSYSSAVLNGAVYVAGHPHDCARVGGFKKVPYHFQRAVAFTTAATHELKANHIKPYSSFGGSKAPTILQWYPYFDTGVVTGLSQGPWSVATSSSGYVAYAGEFRHVNGHGQQGLARFAVHKIVAAAGEAKEGPELHGKKFTLTVKHGKKGDTLKFSLNYDPDNQHLDYKIYRGAVRITTLHLSSKTWYAGSKHTYLDGHGGTGTKYYVRVYDPDGNYATSKTVTAK